MKSAITVIHANPAGNKTLFVKGNVPKEKYAEIGRQLLTMEDVDAEQVGFLCVPKCGGAGRVEMSGGEFCGNASRAFGYYLAMDGEENEGDIPIEISGCDTLVMVHYNKVKSEAYAAMPLPEQIRQIQFPEPFGTLPVVCFEGIWHVIAYDISPNAESFEIIRMSIYERFCPQALGVMFLSCDYRAMTPYVYVRGPETVYLESSCGSGTTAAAFWMAEQDDTLQQVCLKQPAGELNVKIVRAKENVTQLIMGGAIEINPPQNIEIEI